MKIRNIEVDFDFLDADNMEKFEQEAKIVQEKNARNEIANMSMSQAIREECQIIDDFFDKVFGPGISFKMFQGKYNLGEHIKAFEDIVKEKIEKQQDLQNTFNRYQPNREQRRYNKNKGKR